MPWLVLLLALELYATASGNFRFVDQNVCPPLSQHFVVPPSSAIYSKCERVVRNDHILLVVLIVGSINSTGLFFNCLPCGRTRRSPVALPAPSGLPRTASAVRPMPSREGSLNLKIIRPHGVASGSELTPSKAKQGTPELAGSFLIVLIKHLLRWPKCLQVGRSLDLLFPLRFCLHCAENLQCSALRMIAF